MKQKVSILKGIFKIGKEQSNDLGEILDAQANCCAGVSCCEQVLILKDHETRTNGRIFLWRCLDY